MTTTHTPGPWTAAEQFDGDESLGIAVSAGRQEIVRIHDIGREGFANAAVIAAAPELLEALQALVNEYEPNLKVFAENAPRRFIWQKAVAVIARATA